ncbi:uncharacterized protein [Hyperolius riggenbachi]|uniref:uncharacterized protein n=1 Tax=Hyperolius riggenbachi TaxID=752182 RepID=UPI0035A321D4
MGRMTVWLQGVLCLSIIPSGTSGLVFVQSGSVISGCNMTCPHSDGLLELYRDCGGKDETLMELHCSDLYVKYRIPLRIHLDTDSDCWTLTQAGRGDSCVYKIWFHSNVGYPVSSTSIRVLDPVLIYNISSNCSQLGEDIAVTVQFSGEESHVTWELDGGRLPERYRLIDDNRTLIIPSVQRDDAERTFRVRVTNPVSEEARDYRLEVRDINGSSTVISGVAAILVAAVTIYILDLCPEE